MVSRRTFDVKFTTLLAIFLFPLLIHAEVNKRNGNFSVSYVDMEVFGSGGRIEIARTYNSKFPGKGWFGHGWGSYYETNLTLSADGVIVVNENGSGAKTRFTSKTPVKSSDIAQKIVAAMNKSKRLPPAVEKKRLKELKENAEMRLAYAKQLKITATIPSGTQLVSSNGDVLTVTGSGYQRKGVDGRVETFDRAGRLIGVAFRSVRVHVDYKGKEHPHSIKDNKGNQIFFDWKEGLVTSIRSSNNTQSAYKYDGNHDLREAQDAEGIVHKHDYDSKHNMTKITYVSERPTTAAESQIEQPYSNEMTIGYDPKTGFVSQVVHRNGDVVKYDYGANPKRPKLHFWTTVTVVPPAGGGERTWSGKSRYEYEIRIHPNGHRYTHRTLVTLGGASTETLFHKDCGKPRRITQNGRSTVFQYDKKCFLEKKTSPGEGTLHYAYHEKLKKVERVTGKDGWTKFQYSGSGILFRATNAQGMSVTLARNSYNKIRKIVYQDTKKKRKDVLNYRYKSRRYPSSIELEGVGVMTISYEGGRMKVKSKKSSKEMAPKVARIFKSVNSLLTPAGVTVNI